MVSNFLVDIMTPVVSRSRQSRTYKGHDFSHLHDIQTKSPCNRITRPRHIGLQSYLTRFSRKCYTFAALPRIQVNMSTREGVPSNESSAKESGPGTKSNTSLRASITPEQADSGRPLEIGLAALSSKPQKRNRTRKSPKVKPEGASSPSGNQHAEVKPKKQRSRETGLNPLAGTGEHGKQTAGLEFVKEHPAYLSCLLGGLALAEIEGRFNSISSLLLD